MPLASALQRARGLPRSTWGTAFAHFGLGLTLLGIVGETQWGVERIVALKPAETVSIARLRSDLRRLWCRARVRTTASMVAQFTVRRNGEVLGVLESSKRTFSARHACDHRGGADDARRSVSSTSRSAIRMPDGSIVVRALPQAAGAADLDRRRW